MPKLKPFYVYLYRDPRPGKRSRFSCYNAPIYVGVGLNGRAYEHLELGEKHPNDLLRGILRECLRSNLKPIIKIVKRFNKRVDAFKHEIRLIAKYGRRHLNTGTLCNLTPGGQGGNGPGQLAGYNKVKDTVAKKNAKRMSEWNLDAIFQAKCQASRVSNKSAQKAAITRIERAKVNPDFYLLLTKAILKSRRNESKAARKRRNDNIRATCKTSKHRAKQRASWTPERRAAQSARCTRLNLDPKHQALCQQGR